MMKAQRLFINYGRQGVILIGSNVPPNMPIFMFFLFSALLLLPHQAAVSSADTQPDARAKIYSLENERVSTLVCHFLLNYTHAAQKTACHLYDIRLFS